MNYAPLSKKALDLELKKLYRKWPEMRRYLKTIGCDSINAEDLFQEALLIFMRKVESVDFKLEVDSYFYVKNTCKLLWYNQARKENKMPTSPLEKDVELLQDDWMEKEFNLRMVEKTLLKMGNQCRELLQLFYGKGWNMTAIATKIGLRNDKVAKAQKYRCLQKAKELVVLEISTVESHLS